MKTVKKPNKWKHVVYLILALAMLVYALPLISFDPGAGWVSLFGAVWAGFTFLVIGAHLHFLLGVSEEKQRELDKIRRAKLREWELKWQEEGGRGQSV
ncbi:hypothetical protein HMSSN036_33790 [Paenibacillus macerans]|uniref:hypothetical protein n=1 Tax=Paenibacillus TaxID=44249 RepID=UPI00097AAEF4|nr:hypothetical protein [Paenibacillus macerans]MDU7475439.1 hypothetical protein [Paenibacillus macerans]MED4958053.1 hypothetical protein [Paenibacillus macerans]OMG47667.1 hypothetical protein BK140_20510 [Paenibacillus macerans]GJM71163.1 hypothetical protein HMSSN036_33790 [Paenibacillus macerans]